MSPLTTLTPSLASSKGELARSQPRLVRPTFGLGPVWVPGQSNDFILACLGQKLGHRAPLVT